MFTYQDDIATFTYKVLHVAYCLLMGLWLSIKEGGTRIMLTNSQYIDPAWFVPAPFHRERLLDPQSMIESGCLPKLPICWGHSVAMPKRVFVTG